MLHNFSKQELLWHRGMLKQGKSLLKVGSADWAQNLCLNHDPHRPGRGARLNGDLICCSNRSTISQTFKYCQYFRGQRICAFFNVQIKNFFKSCQYYPMTEEADFLVAALEDWASDLCANKSGLEIANWKCFDRKIYKDIKYSNINMRQ